MARRRKGMETAMTVSVDVPRHIIHSCIEHVIDQMRDDYGVDVTEAQVLETPAVTEYITKTIVKELTDYGMSIDVWFMRELDYETVFAKEIRQKEAEDEAERQKEVADAVAAKQKIKETGKAVYVSEKDLQRVQLILSSHRINNAS